MTRIFPVLILVSLCSCASVSTVNFGVGDPGVTQFAFYDGRQSESTKSTKIRDGKVTVIYVGDEKFTPPVPVILKARLHEKLGPKLAAKKVTLLFLEIEVREKDPEINEAAYNSSTAGVDPISALIAGMIIKGIEGRKVSKAVNIELRAALDDREFSVTEHGFFKSDGEAEIRRLVLSAVGKAVDSVEALLTE